MTRLFTRDHEWIDVEAPNPAGESVGTVGITDYAQAQLGDITFVETPAPGATVKPGEAAGVVDSVKAASDVYSPASGTVIAANPVLADTPELVNSDAEGTGWLFRITLSDPLDLARLMDRAAYDAYVAEL